MGHLSTHDCHRVAPRSATSTCRAVGARARAWASLRVMGWRNQHENKKEGVKDRLGEQQETAGEKRTQGHFQAGEGP